MLFANIDILDENLDHKRGMFVGIEGSHVTYVGAEEPADTARFGERYDGTGKLLMSAFYNTHAHTPMTLLRGYAENQPLQQWLNDTVWPFEGKMDMEKKHHYWGCMLSQAEMLRYGVVGYTDMYFATIDRCEATLEAGMKANHCDGGTMCFVETDYDTLPVAAVNEQLFAEYQNAGDGRVKIDMCVHGEYTTPQGMIERCVAEAKAHAAALEAEATEKLETARRTMQDLLHSASARLGGDQDGLGAMTASVSAQLAALQEQLGGMTDFLRETAETLSNVPLK